MDKLARREAILNGVIHILANRGLDGLTHRAVDEAIGLSQGSTSYYYSKKSVLLIATIDHLTSILEKNCDELQVGFSDRVAQNGMDDAIEYVAEELASYAETSRDLFLARMELTMATARQIELTGVGNKLADAARRPIAFFLKLISEDKSDVPIDICAGMIDGMAFMYATGQGPKPSKEHVATVLRAIL